jgi:hypothetical protein
MMPLDNTAKVRDIITSLQNLTGINQKADLKSALIAKGLSISDNDNIADMINKLNNGNLVLNGKRWASGTVTSNSTQEVYTYSANTSGTNAFSVVVTGLTFTPSTILIHGMDNTIYTSVYSQLLNNGYPAISYLYSGSIYNLKLTTPGYVNNSGFKLPVSAVTTSFKWLAIE